MKCQSGKREEEIARRAVRAIEEGKSLVFVFAPTGYGKTKASPFILKLARERGLAQRLIHVAPTRALVQEIFKSKFMTVAEDCRFHAAYQSLDRIAGGQKSPYFLADLVVTTLESFLLNVFKLPPAEIGNVVAELSEGHYYPAVLSLATSIVILDEAHLYIAEAEENSAALVAAAISALRRMKVPVVVMTATMPLALFRSIMGSLRVSPDEMKILYVCAGRCEQLDELRRYDVERIDDDMQRFLDIDWRTYVVTREEAIQRAREKCKDTLVLWVSDTVKGAAAVYDELEGCERVLVHGRLSERDKRGALAAAEKMREEKRGIIVASPIVEVGLDIDASVLISEVSEETEVSKGTRIENLVQRAGRLFRRAGRGVAEVMLYGNGNEVMKTVEETLKRGETIDWRSPGSFPEMGRTSYVQLMERGGGGTDLPRRFPFLSLLEGVITSDSRPLNAVKRVADVSSGAGSLFTSLSLLKVKVGEAYDDYVIVSTKQMETDWVQWGEDGEEEGVKVELVVRDKAGREGRRHAVLVWLGRVLRRNPKFRLLDLEDVKRIRYEIYTKLDEGEVMMDFFLLAGEGKYRRGRGLGA